MYWLIEKRYLLSTSSLTNVVSSNINLIFERNYQYLMAFEPKLTVYTITTSPERNNTNNSNRWLFRNLIGEANGTSLQDTYIFSEIFKLFIESLDTPEMYSDRKSKKSITANQPNIEDPDVSPNIRLHPAEFMIEGVIEGGTYGRKRNKTSILNKANKSDVTLEDAITSDFYFLIYMPPASNKSILMIQSYSGDSVDTVVKAFWEKFLTIAEVFKKPKFKRHIPEAIINDFKKQTTVSSLQFETDIPGQTLIQNTRNQIDKKFKVKVIITPVEDDLTMDEFEEASTSLRNVLFTASRTLGDFIKRKGRLRDNETRQTSPFELDSNFEIEPVIQLSKYLNMAEGMNFPMVGDFCKNLLNDKIKAEIYLTNAIQER